MTQFNIKPEWVNLASSKLGAKAIFANDEFFAPKERMLQPQEAVFIPDKYDDHGKWMDGWETRRKRGAGYDHCIIELAKAGVIHAIIIDTSHFTGNYPPAASIDACYLENAQPDETTSWEEIISKVELKGDEKFLQEIHISKPFTHLRVNIYPDGGIARLRVYGTPRCDWEKKVGFSPDILFDLAYSLNGAYAMACNNEHFGTMHNMLNPNRGENMGDGWETRRRRDIGHDWAIICLGNTGIIKKIIIDTLHFKGNYPDKASIEGIKLKNPSIEDLKQSNEWKELLPAQKLSMNRDHTFTSEIEDIGVISHVRLNIFPDGGVSRLRLFGQIKDYD